MRKFLCVVLSVLMITTVFPLIVFAADSADFAVKKVETDKNAQIVLSVNGNGKYTFESAFYYTGGWDINITATGKATQNINGEQQVAVKLDRDKTPNPYYAKTVIKDKTGKEVNTVYNGNCGVWTDWYLVDGTLTVHGEGEMRKCGFMQEDLASWYSVKDEIEKVVIENGITKIGECSFIECENLKHIEIGHTVVEIKSMAFYNCPNLEKVVIPSSIKQLGSEILGPDGVEKLYFTGSELEWKTIAMDRPADYENTEVVFDYKDAEIPDDTVGDDYELNKDIKWSVTNGVLTVSGKGDIEYVNPQIGGQPWDAYKDKITTVIIEEGITSICQNAFAPMPNLAKIEIANTVKSIGEFAFNHAGKITEVTIPESVEFIDGNAFGNCENLKKITVDSNNKYYSNDENGALYNKDKSVLIAVPAGIEAFDYKVQDTVKTIGKHAFYMCNNFTGITLPDGLLKIEEYGFAACHNLLKISVPESVEYIGQSAFDQCYALQNAEINCKITELAESIFTSCRKLKNINIPSSVKTIGMLAFYGCNNLQSITIPEGVERIEPFAFDSCHALESIEIPDGVAFIGENAFNWCSQLKEVYIPATVKEIGRKGFDNCTELKTIYYDGNEEQFKQIDMKENSFNNLSEKEIIYNAICVEEILFTLDDEKAVVNLVDKVTPDMFFKSYGSEAEIYDGDGEKIVNGFIGTGSKIKIGEKEYAVKVMMDIDGNGRITALDARFALRAGAGLDKLEGIYFDAADVNSDGFVRASDARLTLRKSAGLD